LGSLGGLDGKTPARQGKNAQYLNALSKTVKTLAVFLLFFAAFAPVGTGVFAQDNEKPKDETEPTNISIGRFSFFMAAKILEDGSIQDGGISWNYSDSFSGELRGRWARTEKNEEFEGVQDSLNAASQETVEIFLLPLEYAPFSTDEVKLWAGIGGYYYNEKLKEKGFFNMIELDLLGLEKVNSYKNEFSMNMLGPLIDLGFTYRGSKWFKASLSGGISPIFATWAKQSVSIIPLLEPDNADYSQNHFGSPYIYMDLSGTICLPKITAMIKKQSAEPSDWKAWVSLLYDYSRLQYEVLDFIYDGNKFSWYTPEQTVKNQSFKLEGALMIPLGAMYFQIGAGRIFDSITADSGSALKHEKNYLILSGRNGKLIKQEF